MTVYVDDMRKPARVGRIKARWSHLLADTSEELHAFASRIGMRPEWVQYPGTPKEHYDLTDARRADALRLGAQSIRYPSEVGPLIARKRDAHRQEANR